MPHYDEDHAPHAQWSITDEGYKPSGQTGPSLPPGIYKATTDGWHYPTLAPMDPKMDELVPFKTGVFADVVSEIAEFWRLGELYKRFGFLHRRGYLLYGPQGCGKSSLIYQVADEVKKMGHVALICEDANDFLICSQSFRKVEPYRPMVCVLEDIDELIEARGEAMLLQWLDGNAKTDNVVTLASTNYPEKLDRRMIARPRRFDRLIKVGPPDLHQRQLYFAHKIPGASSAEINMFAEMSSGLSFASLADLVISVKCLRKSIHESVALLRQLEGGQPSSQEDFLSGLENECSSGDEDDKPKAVAYGGAELEEVFSSVNAE